MTLKTRQGWAFALAITVFFAIAGTIGAPTARAATATTTFTGSDRLTPRPEAVAPTGELRLVTTYQVPAADVGCLATFTVHAVNGDSVHFLNYGLIVTGDESAKILDTESEPNVDRTRLTDRTLLLGETISLYNVIGPWSDGDTTRPEYVGTSVDYRVGYTCNTTTTTSSTSTTTSTTPTTSGPTPSSSTTTTASTSSTTILVPPAPPPTAPTPPTTYVIVDEPPGTVTIPPVTSPPTLPYTGPADHLEVLAGLAVAGMAAGTVVLYLARARGRHEA